MMINDDRCSFCQQNRIMACQLTKIEFQNGICYRKRDQCCTRLAAEPSQADHLVPSLKFWVLRVGRILLATVGLYSVCRGANGCPLGCPLPLFSSKLIVSQNELLFWKTTRTNFWTKEGQWILLGAPICSPICGIWFYLHILKKLAKTVKELFSCPFSRTGPVCSFWISLGTWFLWQLSGS